MGTTLVRDPSCTLCRLHKTAEFVCLLGKGPVPSKIAIIGEAPGRREDQDGEPFVGTAGQILRKALKEVKIDPSKVFITNAVSCRPPENRTPTKGEINTCKYWLDYQLDRVKPKYVLLLGNVPCQAVLGKKGITNLRGKPVELNGITYLPTFHPAAFLYDPSKEETFNADLRLFAEIVHNQGISKEDDFNPIEVKDKRTFKRMLRSLEDVVSFDIETSGLYPFKQVYKGRKNEFYDSPVITSIGFGTKDAQWSIPFDHYETRDIWSKSDRRVMVRKIGKKLKNCTVVCQFGKFDMLWMRVVFGARWKVDFDTGLAHYMLDENSRHGLEHLAIAYLGAMPYDLDATREPWNRLFPYHARDLYYTRKLYYVFKKKLHREGNVAEVFNQIVMPCVDLFADAEFNGVYVDHDKFDEAEVYLLKQIKEVRLRLKQYKRGVNWRSTQQVAKLLFDKKKDGGLGLKIIETTKTGNPSTAEGVLKRIDHPITRDLITLRGANQQLSFFIEGWKPYLVNGFLHPHFKIHGTVTGRPSCEHPNLQQVPRDSRIRSLIIAPPEWELVECDLSQIELRIAAELADESTMLTAFYNKQDIHWLTAMREISRQGSMPKLVKRTASKLVNQEVTNYGDAIHILLKQGHRAAISVNEEWKEHRKKAKAINFGYLYGMWWKKFQIYAFDNYGIVVSEIQAQESRKAYFDLYKDLPEWHERQKRYARRHGYVTTLTGRKRRLPEAQLPYDCKERGSAERQAINSPVQGFAAELNLMAALQLKEEFRDEVRICGTIHDSVLFLSKKNNVHVVVPRMLQIMTRPKIMDTLDIKFRVPIEAEASIGPWSKGVSLDEYLDKAG